MHYTWAPPLISAGQRVRFRDHRGKVRDGECYAVETRYDPKGVAKHCYRIGPDGWERALWLSDKNIVLPPNTQ